MLPIASVYMAYILVKILPVICPVSVFAYQ